jgi:hypothetical protein
MDDSLSPCEAWQASRYAGREQNAERILGCLNHWMPAQRHVRGNEIGPFYMELSDGHDAILKSDVPGKWDHKNNSIKRRFVTFTEFPFFDHPRVLF